MKILNKFSKSVFIFIINLLLLEAGLQLTYFLFSKGSFLANRATGQPLYMHNYEWGTYGLRPDYYAKHKTDEFENDIYIDKRGMRVKDFSGKFINQNNFKSSSSITGLAIGPSYGFGWGSNYEQSYNYLIAEYLSNQLKTPLKLLNTSVPSQPIGQQMCRLIKEISKDPIPPKFVSVTVFPGLEYLEDSCVESFPEEVWNNYLVGKNDTKFIKFKKLFKNSGIIYFSFLLSTKIMPPIDSDKLENMEKYIKIENKKSKENILNSAKKIRDNLGQIPIFYIRMPHTFQYHKTHINRWRSVHSLNKILELARSEEENWNYALQYKDQFKKKNIYLIDTLPLLKKAVRKGEIMAYYLDTHLTPKGNYSIFNSFINQVDKNLINKIKLD